MSTTFADYVDNKPAMDEQISNIERYAVLLCDALYLDVKYEQLRYNNNAVDHVESDSFKGDKEYERNYHINKIRDIDANGVDHELFDTQNLEKRKSIVFVGSLSRFNTSRGLPDFIKTYNEEKLYKTKLLH